ncbi:MAG: TonB-dependent receptor [Bacteroidales bacterium]|nr:TonB-dependent receptor [Bacteroidales bacterium]
MCLLLPMLLAVTALAQNIRVKGTIIDDERNPVIGATIMVKGTTNGTTTDFDGNFSIEAEKNAILAISYIGFESQEIFVTSENVQVQLKSASEMLDEFIVVGYGTMKKSDMTGAISSVDVGELTKRATTNAAEALQGKISGVNIQKSGGNAGAGVQVKIRGVGTMGDNNPLYIIDGFPGDINNVNPLDIESMEVLKDGAAAAIYGSVAANGVIIITTKNGKKGDIKVDVSAYVSMTQIAKKLEMLNAEQYKSVHKQMYENWNAYDAARGGSKQYALPAYITTNTGVDTDWQDAMMRNGVSQNYNISVRGGSEHAKYALSYNHADDMGIFLGNDYRQDNVHMKMHLTKYIFDLDANLGLKVTDSKQPNYSIKEMYMISPLVPIYDENEKYGFGLTNFNGLPNNRNVMADHHYTTTKDRSYNTDANVALSMRFTPWLTFKSSYGYRGVHGRSSEHTPDYIADEKSKNIYPIYSESTSYWESHIWENTLSFNKDFGKHRVNALAGTSMHTTNYTWNSISVEGKTTVYKVEDGKLIASNNPAGFLDPYFSTINAGAGGTYSGSGSRWKYHRASFFGRLNYAYDDRYLVQATVRRDGSSKFGKDSRWGFFPSVALGWRISQEDFFPEDTFIDNLKLRASWGRLGNENALGYYDFQALISTYNTKSQGYVRGNGDNAWVGSIARGLENRSLQWETADTKNIGIDFALFNSALSGSLNYYNSQTEDLLITKRLAPSSGLDNPVLNVGKMKNTGFEIELNYNGKVGNDFEYNVGMNLTTTKNEVTHLADEDQVLYGEGLKYGTEHFPTQTRVGKPIAGFWLYKTDGIFQSDAEVANYKNKDGEMLQPKAAAGDIRFVDTNGDGVIDDDDKVYCGSGIPKVEANLNLGANYKGFDVTMTFGSAFGHKLYNGNRYFYESMNSGSNLLKSSLNAWTPTNTNTSVPRAIFQDPNSNSRESDRFLEKGNFFRMRLLQVGYTLPSSLCKKAYLENVRFYVSGENLFTITSYDGIDPEFSRANVLNTGIDKLIYPFTRSYTLGVQVSF